MRLITSLLLLLVAAVAAPASLTAQHVELGVKAGFAMYSGDLSPKEFGIYWDDMNFAGGAYLRYHPESRFGVRVNANFGRISAESNSLVAPNDDRELVSVDRNFRSSIQEFNVVLEYDLLYIGDRYGSSYLAGYLYGGPGVLSFNPESEIDGVYTELQPLATEGQGSGLSPEYDATRYELTRIVGVLGGGIRVRIADRFTVGLELGGRITGMDYLDDISDTSVRYLDVLQGDNGGLAARFSNPNIQNPSEATNITYRRGGDAMDYYFVGGLTVGIALGGGGSRKSGCYTF